MSDNIINRPPGPIILFGSGETLPSSGPAYDFVAGVLSDPLDISILETPAGFQVNTENVAQNVADFIKKRLLNHNPHIRLIPARAKGTDLSPDDANVLEPMLLSNWVFMGPGSPTYTIRQLKNSLALKYLYAMHYNGAALTLSSAAVLAISSFTLPVYEIYKVGEDLHWVKGLGFLKKYGLDIVCIPHWNNQDGGKDLDTSRCFMGLQRFNKLEAMLKPGKILVGIDEQTAFCLKFDDSNSCKIFGKGTVTIIKNDVKQVFTQGDYELDNLGLSLSIPDRDRLIDGDTWTLIKQPHQEKEKLPTLEIMLLVNERESVRINQDWEAADRLRKKVEKLGWDIEDSPDGPSLVSR
jgi:cyanophycinase-like exopeptidase